MPQMPPWAARLLLYIVAGSFVLFGAPTLAWIGKRYVKRWERQLKSLKEENEQLKEELREIHRELSSDHEVTKKLLRKVLDEVQS
jgi:hypothetical protein